MQEDIINKYCLGYLPDDFKDDFVKWFTGQDGASEDCVQARGQAVEAYPALAYRICRNKEIREAVEQKKSLTSALAKYYEVDEKAIKRLQGKTATDLGIEETPVIIKDILHMKEKYFQQFKNNLSDIEILRNYSQWPYNFSLNQFLDYLSLKSGNPLQHIERMRKNSHWDVRDGFLFLHTRLFFPALLNRLKDHAEINNLTLDHNSWFFISEDILKDITNFKTILDFSERYHRNLFRWEDMFTFDSGMKDISWDPMFAKIDLGNGWIAREIDSVALLKEQGEKENHCVGGYADSILERDDDSAQLIFSLEKNGQIKSTIDIVCSKNKEETGLNVIIQQNRAHSNKDPSQETLDFSDSLVQKIKNNCFLNTDLDSTSFLAENLLIKSESISKLNTYLDNLDIAREEYKKCKNENYYLSICGYNPWDREILEIVWDEFKPALPSKLRRLGLDGFIEMIPICDGYFKPREKDDLPDLWDEMKNENPVEIERDEGGAEMVM